MLQSMTGYGKAVGIINDKKITVEIKSLNSKQLDLSVRIPNLYREKELEIRSVIAQKIKRGKVDFSLFVENNGKDDTAKINPTVVKSYFEQLTTIAQELGVSAPNDLLSVIMRLPDSLKTELEELDETEWNAILSLVNQALEQLINFRIQEGNVLKTVFADKIDKIGTLLVDIEPFESERVDKIKSRLEENLQGISEKIAFDKNRLEQELIYYIEKLDVNEEKSRLKNHLTYFIQTMQNEPTPGKKLGFIAQEIGREINTLGSKSSQCDMQQIVVQMKDELEQIKEQVLNTL